MYYTLKVYVNKVACAQVDLRHMDEQAGSNVVSVGVDLSEFYMSVEWDILEVPAVRFVFVEVCISKQYVKLIYLSVNAASKHYYKITNRLILIITTQRMTLLNLIFTFGILLATDHRPI